MDHADNDANDEDDGNEYYMGFVKVYDTVANGP